MATSTFSVVWPIFALLLGAVGAIAGIFIKEAAQAAMQRRVLTWQLFGYITSWKLQITRNLAIFTLYTKISERQKKLTAAYGNTEEFKQIHLEQANQTKNLKEKIKNELMDILNKKETNSLGEFSEKGFVDSAIASLIEQRNFLADSKSFISDKDASQLGKAVAMNVVQFRTSLFFMMSSLECILKEISNGSNLSSTFVTSQVDSIITYGEEFLIAFIRLENNVDWLSKKSIISLASLSLK
ncbi:hypothetical protein [Burkholderia vietnamiensis]|uniref:hypothetical protein n=3 Tax=Burkholderia vietnamiensis TaxID=60552 RepID=UPI001589C499|nr:hypothetical protein [Burkholderia vietnamiensis]MBH9648125.1 hypothetical protein [Burkholderia vietnamiensis]